MVYKIQSDKQSLMKIFDAIESFGDFMFIYDTFYLSSESELSSIKKKIKKNISKDGEFFVSEINISNLSNQPPSLQTWIRDKLLKSEIKKYESENQDVLEKFNTLIDMVYEEYKKEKEVEFKE